MMLTQQKLKKVLDYDPNTGIFTWRVRASQRSKIGDTAGAVCPKGYVNIQIDCIKYRAHRLAWLYVYGCWPTKQIDHKNTVKHHNSRKRKSNKSGIKGVSWNTSKNKWIAQAQMDGKKHHIGQFDDINKASDAYQKFAKEYHNEFFC